MFLSWLKRRRRRKLLGQPFPQPWLAYLEQYVPLYRRLPPALRSKLQPLVQVFVAEKEWVGCGGLVVTDEMKVAVAGQACVLLLGIDGGYCFDGVRTILLYPGSYHQPPQWQTHQLLVDEELAMQGEAWHRGPIVLSWDQVLANSRGQSDGQSLVIHEFSHHLDGLDGEVGGTPPLARPADYQRWNQVMSTEFQQLEYSARRGEPTLLDPYGASDPAEFFAVASECFFEEPCEMRSVHPDLYDLLKGFYRLDPQAWFPPGGPEQT